MGTAATYFDFVYSMIEVAIASATFFFNIVVLSHCLVS